jgi:hypothetical protein
MSFPFTQWPLRCCQSLQTCTAFAEIFMCLNSADQLKVEPTGQVIDKTQDPGKLHWEMDTVFQVEWKLNQLRFGSTWKKYQYMRSGHMYKASIHVFWYSMLTGDHWKYQLWKVTCHDSQEFDWFYPKRRGKKGPHEWFVSMLQCSSWLDKAKQNR